MPTLPAIILRCVLRTLGRSFGPGLVCLSTLLVTGASPGAEVEGLYVAQIPVEGKGSEDRERAVGAALREVLVKVSGERAAGSDPGIGQAMERPSRYLQQYRYETVMRTAEDGRVLPVPVLAVAFDPSAVDELLRAAGLPVWGRVRPALLAWLALEQGGQRTLVAPSEPPGVAESLRGAAERRGLPLVLPLLDLEDRASLRVADVWGGFPEPIERASRRYDPEAILVGRLYPRSASRWEGRWSLLLGAAVETWESTAERLDRAIDDGVQAAADRLAARFASRATGTSRVDLTVVGVSALEDYARTVGYLRGLDLVTAVQVRAVEGDSIQFAIEVRGGRSALEQIFSLGRTLVPEAPAPGAVALVPPGRFRLLAQ